jgi:predicted Zn-dependent protease
MFAFAPAQGMRYKFVMRTFFHITFHGLFRNVRTFVWIVPVLTLLVGCASVDPVTGNRVANFYTIEDDINLGTGVMRDITEEMKKQNVPVNADRARLAQIREMVRRIAAVSHLPTLPYEVVLFETNIVNAAAAPGGKIIVFSGLYHPEIGLARNENEIAAVIAHVTCRHTTESLTRRIPTDLLLIAGAAYAEAKDKDNLAIAMGAAFIAYEGFYLPRYSRVDESEADAVGLMYMAKAGYDPRAAPELWRRVEQQEGNPTALVRWMSSHPSHGDRHEALEKLLPAAIAEYEKVRRP